MTTTTKIRPKPGDLALVPSAGYDVHLFRIASIETDNDSAIVAYSLVELGNRGAGVRVEAHRVTGVFQNIIEAK